MEIKLQKRFIKYLLPGFSAVALLVAVVLVLINISSTPTPRTVLIANRDLAEGTALRDEYLTEVKLALGASATAYLSHFEPNLVLVHSLAKGEILSRLNLTKGEDARIPIRLNGLPPISSVIGVGDRVDIWAMEISSTSLSEPQPVAFDAIVTAIETENSMTQIATNLEIRIDSEYLETLLAAMGSNFQLSVILDETLADIE